MVKGGIGPRYTSTITSPTICNVMDVIRIFILHHKNTITYILIRLPTEHKKKKKMGFADRSAFDGTFDHSTCF
jgi:hypothetical protein